MTAPTLYAYDPISGLYTGPAQADPSPLEPGVWLHPANTTETMPPTAGDREAAVYRSGGWSVVPDWRGHGYYTADGKWHTITELGIAPPVDALDAPPPAPVADLKSAAMAAIDSAAGAARARYITVAPGQEATYQAKSVEAESYIAAGRPADATPYPILSAEAAVRGISVSDIADMVIGVRDQWTGIAAQIEAQRISGRLGVEAAAAAEDRAGIATARDAAIAALEVL